MNNQNAALAFLQETITRLSTKSPKFFRIWNWINIAAAVIGAIPTALDVVDYHPIGKLGVAIGKFVALAGLWGFVNSKMSVQRSTVTATGAIVDPVDKDGEIKTTSLPFTEKAEAKKIQNQDVVRVAVDPSSQASGDAK